MMRVEQLMNQPVHTCRRTDSLNRAAQLMWDNDCGVLPVVDDRGLLAGVITDRDICMASYTQGRSLLELVVERAMAKKVFAKTYSTICRRNGRSLAPT